MMAVGNSQSVGQVEYLGPGPTSVLPNILHDEKSSQPSTQQSVADHQDFLQQYGQFQGGTFR